MQTATCMQQECDYSSADLVEAHAVGAHTPVGTREAYGDGDEPGADHGPSHARGTRPQRATAPGAIRK